VLKKTPYNQIIYYYKRIPDDFATFCICFIILKNVLFSVIETYTNNTKNAIGRKICEEYI